MPLHYKRYRYRSTTWQLSKMSFQSVVSGVSQNVLPQHCDKFRFISPQLKEKIDHNEQKAFVNIVSIDTKELCCCFFTT